MRHGCNGALRWSTDGDYTFAALDVAESEHGGIGPAARHAYAVLEQWCRAAPERHVLRIWNYLDAINEGEGDAERYRQFCAGRAAGMQGLFQAGYPAATAIGRRSDRRTLQLYWLAARLPGQPLENPRQLSAWRYTASGCGPKAPNFARAMRSPALHPQTYISGTAAIVGHTSHHAFDCLAQLDETLMNLDSLLGGDRAIRCEQPTQGLSAPHAGCRHRARAAARTAARHAGAAVVRRCLPRGTARRNRRRAQLALDAAGRSGQRKTAEYDPPREGRVQHQMPLLRRVGEAITEQRHRERGKHDRGSQHTVELQARMAPSAAAGQQHECGDQRQRECQHAQHGQ